MKKKKNPAPDVPKKAPKKIPDQKEFTPLYPNDLPLQEKWYTNASLQQLMEVSRGTIYSYRRKGLLRTHKWGGTIRFNKAYVDWMMENGGKKLSWFSMLFTLANNFDWLTDMVEMC